MGHAGARASSKLFSSPSQSWTGNGVSLLAFAIARVRQIAINLLSPGANISSRAPE